MMAWNIKRIGERQDVSGVEIAAAAASTFNGVSFCL